MQFVANAVCGLRFVSTQGLGNKYAKEKALKQLSAGSKVRMRERAHRSKVLVVVLLL